MWGDIVGVWMEPVTAQVMMTLSFAAMNSIPLWLARGSISGRGRGTGRRSALVTLARALMRRQRHQAAIPPGLSIAQGVGWEKGAPIRLYLVHQGACPRDGLSLLVRNGVIERSVARDVVTHAPRRVEVDGLERSHERPPQPEAFADATIDVLG
jgi:hypothetical protein